MKKLSVLLILIMMVISIGGCKNQSGSAEEVSPDDVPEISSEHAPDDGTTETASETRSETETESLTETEEDITQDTETESEETASEEETDEPETETASEETEAGPLRYTYDENGYKVSDDARGFVSISEYIPDVIIEARYYSTYNFVGERIDGYEEPVALITIEGAEALKEVSDEMMQKGYRLKIYDAYRPRQAEAHFVRWARDVNDTRMKEYFYPTLDKSVLFPYGYIAEYSGHCRGSSVDLTLVDMNTGKDVDMGGTFDDFSNVSHPSYTGITSEQYNNRMMLRDCMMRHGFTPINTEWWHFNLAYEPYPDIYFTFPVSSESVK